MFPRVIEHIVKIGGIQRKLDADSYLFHQNDTVRSVFVIMEGLIELTRHQECGKSIVLQRARQNSILAEASVYSGRYHCDAIVKMPSIVIEISKRRFRKKLHDSQIFSELWMTHLAREVQSARYKSEILSKRTVAERLDSWLAWKGGSLPEKGQWKSIAEQIGVSPEALYREIAKR